MIILKKSLFRLPIHLSLSVSGAILVAVLALAPVPAGAAILSEQDAKNAKAAFQAMDRNRWKSVRRLTTRIKDPTARRLLRWADLTRRGASATFGDYAAFLKDSPDPSKVWPYTNRLLARAEETMRDDTPDAQILDWQATYGMTTGYGKARLARILLKQGKTEKARALLRDAWINGNFTKAREKHFYRRYRKHLSAEDHIKRVERLLWSERYWPSRRMLWKISKQYRLLVEARLMLMRRTGNVDTAIARVPKQFKDDPGLLFERLRWRRRKGKSSAFTLLREKTIPDLIRPDKWWKERAYLARASLRKGKAIDAYTFSKNHNLSEGAHFADAEWLSGWIALRFLNNPRAALDHFTRLTGAVKYPISLSRAHYWKARALEALGRKKDALADYQEASRHSGFFYGQLAAQRLDGENGLTLLPAPAINKTDKKIFEADERVKAARILAELDQKDRLRPFILTIMVANDSPAWKAMSGNLAADLGRTDLGVFVAKIAERGGTRLLELSYPSLVPPPLPKGAQGQLPERPLVMAMIRQESAFHVSAKSRANALGLMQILPGTARRVARQVKMRYSKAKLTRDAHYNLTLGQSYLAGLLREFKGSYVMAIAAYNAGPSRARQWARNSGDPREAGTDPIDWVEMIPFNETRDYVQRVLENLQVYRQKLNPKTKVAFNLAQDLKRPR